MTKRKIIPFLLAAAVLAAVVVIGGIKLLTPKIYITQYADETGMQAMFYTIEAGGKLIVIDGGNAGNANYVRSNIEQKGGHVHAWILTHPHPDHIGAFNVLWNEMADQIDAVYAPEMDYDAYLAKAREWDGFEDYVEFLNYMADCDKLKFLHRGDEQELFGLKMQVFSAYNAYVNQISGDLANDGSLMLKFTAKQESMLFCSDIGKVMSDSILVDYKDQVDCDYIQMGHHGNGGLSEEFYRLTTPKGAFFDAPEWLMNPGENPSNYSTPANRKLMEDMGAQIYYYVDAPHRIELK